MPKEISGEILLGKFKGILKSFIGVIFLLYGVLSIWYYFFLKSHNNVVINHFNTIFVSLLFGIIVLILGIFLFFFGIFQYNNFRLYAKKYNNEFQNDDTYAQYPPFLREIYIKRIKARYYIILIAAITYTFSLIFFPILYVIQKYQGDDFSFAWWKIGSTPNVHDIIIWSWAIIGLVTLLFLINILINEKRHSIISIYTSNNVLSSEEKVKIAKETKKKCLIIYLIFLALLIIIFIIPFIIFLVKKLKKKK